MSKVSMSDSTAQQIDASVRNIVDTIFAQTIELLEKNRDILETCAKALLEKETLEEAQLLELTKEMYKYEQATKEALN